MNFSLPSFIQKLFPSIVWSIKPISNEKIIYLTFDDGPTPEITHWVLDTLDKYNAKATFFCIAKNIDRHPNIFKEITERGHSAGNHSYSHLKGWETSFNEYVNDIELANNIIKSNLFRPPYARFSLKQLNYLKKKYNIILWNVLSRDYSKWVTPKKCTEIVCDNIKDGAIIVFHDSKKAFKNLSHALPILLDSATKQGYICKEIVMKNK